jgi:arylsulfatase A-like enzyme
MEFTKRSTVAVLLLLFELGMLEAASFRRGDSNDDGVLDLSDGIFTLAWLFSGADEPGCHDAADTNDDGTIDLSDAVHGLAWLFAAGASPPAPGPSDCGVDPTQDTLDCTVASSCSEMPPAPRNILLIISDDVGVSFSRCHDGAAVATPNIESLCAEGVVFRNAWALPVCSPTRASLLTGRYPFRHGIGDVAGGTAGIGLDEQTIPMALESSALDYAHGCFGKWHLSSDSNGNADNPTLMGFDHYSGSLRGGVGNYFTWDKTVNGSTTTVTSYATSENVDDALEWIEGQGERPWLVWLAFNASHTPFHLPPAGLHSFADLSGARADIAANPTPYYEAAIEAMDTEIGRLLGSLAAETLENTTIIYLGDNGSPAQVAGPRNKGTLYQGGVHVPLTISGAGVASSAEVEALVDVTDLFATILELAGVDVEAVTPVAAPIDSVSLVPYLEDPDRAALRQWVLAERFGPEVSVNQAGRAIRDERYKLIRFDNRGDELYALDDDPGESNDLLDTGSLSSDAQSHYDSLSATLDGLQSEG